MYSKWKGSGAPIFPKTNRVIMMETSKTRRSTILFIFISIATPGPGTYRIQTDFGFYD